MKKVFFLIITILSIVQCTKDSPSNSEASSQVQEDQITQPTQQDQSNTFSLYVNDQDVKSGEQVCLDVQTTHFNSIISMQYTLNWDPNLLQFTKLDNLNLADFNEGNFNLQRASKGQIISAWFDPNIQGITKADESTIYSLCFDVIGSSGSSSYIYFGSDPTVIEISDPSGQIEFYSPRTTVSIQ